MIKIIQDTREQKGLGFSFAECEVSREKLSCGDYTSEKLKDFLRIERKASVGELYYNLAGKKEKERFHRELVELTKFEFPIICCEFSEQNLYSFPKGSGIPFYLWPKLRMGAAYLRKLIYEITEQYNIPIYFLDDKDSAEVFIYNLIKALECTEFIK